MIQCVHEELLVSASCRFSSIIAPNEHAGDTLCMQVLATIFLDFV
ncbi:hypothetical protein [Sporolactobacillus spathodeae]|uniref:Uncharacterized protein n=1 Tax=Sporolactobacillus spathodeae TaxID=1465502 RepID=A0ABS2QAS6_9BACL|nr:hypothetical protein [Sporolactobacillus spathodeae]MBM7658077.1 hypothetical protein [Sporolactobacillus spathodeae]